MTKCWEFDLDLKTRKIKTFVYSDTGTDIQERFTKGYEVSNIKEIDDPLLENKKVKK
jgi:hypothetical protein|tara:strand:- start:1061 stop:1231 length:171 start_codon:yes stop_codon:yes gene_type:complete